MPAPNQPGSREPRGSIIDFLQQTVQDDELWGPHSSLLHLPDLFSPPEEYEDLLAALERTGCVAIYGASGSGKTLTGLMVLWEHFVQGWTVEYVGDGEVWRGESRAECLLRWLTDGNPEPNTIVHIDDAGGYGRTPWIEAHQEQISHLLQTAREVGDVRVVVTAREPLPGLQGIEVCRGLTYSPDELRRLVASHSQLLPTPRTAAEIALLQSLVPAALPTPGAIALCVSHAPTGEGLGELPAFAQACRSEDRALAEWLRLLSPERRLFLLMVRWLCGWRNAVDGTPVDGPSRALHALVHDAHSDGAVPQPPPPDPWGAHATALANVLTDAGRGSREVQLAGGQYEAAIDAAVRADCRVAAQFRFLVDWCLHRPEAWLRSAIAVPVAVGLAGEGRALGWAAEKLAKDSASSVRGAFAAALGSRYSALGRAGRRLCHRLSADPQVAGKLAYALGAVYLTLDDDGRHLAETLAEAGETARYELRSGLERGRPALGPDGLALLCRLIVADGEPSGLPMHWMEQTVGRSFAALKPSDREPFVHLAQEHEIICHCLAEGLSDTYPDLDAHAREVLRDLAARDRGAREWLARGLAGSYSSLDAQDRSLLRSLSTDEQTSRVVARALGESYRQLCPEGRTLCRELAASSREAMLSLARGLADCHYRMDAEGMTHLWELTADPEVARDTARELASDYAELDERGRRLCREMAQDDPKVAEALARELFAHYESVPPEDRELCQRLAARSPALRDAMLWQLTWWPTLEPRTRAFVLSLAETDDKVRLRLAEHLGRHYADLDEDDRALCEQLVRSDAAIRAALCEGLAHAYDDLGADGRAFFAGITERYEDVRPRLLWALTNNYANLDPEERRLCRRLAEGAGDGALEAAYTMGFNAATLDADGRDFVRELAARSLAVRCEVVEAMGANYEELDRAARELCAELIEGHAEAASTLAHALGLNESFAGEEGRDLLARLKADGNGDDQ